MHLGFHYELGNDLVFVNKPAGISTHAPDHDLKGMAELVEDELLKKIYVVHRLDKTTTGCLVFATTEQRAKELFEDFKAHRVEKKYVFLTNQRPDFTEITIRSEIVKVGKEFKNIADSPNPNAVTHFKKDKLNALFQRWQAFPETGKPHQIRLHAKQAGIPILGDSLYGGSTYPHLCLHAESLQIPGEKIFQSPQPPFFERMGLIRDQNLAKILSAFDRRQRLFNFLKKPNEVIRLSHLENKFRIDALGPILWIYWYDQKDPSISDLEIFEFLGVFLSKKVHVRKMLDRGQDPNSKTDWKIPNDLPTVWQAEENSMQFQFRSNQGLSPGLFLDQRGNRKMVQDLAVDRSVLNLFAYTGGFSVAAALGGAKQVTTVDLSPKFLEWAKENFKLNDLDPKNYQFFAQDSFSFLEKTIKMKRKFNIVICDPPSFSRSPKGIFKIESDLARLLSLCWQVLEPQGILLFSSNFEKWTASDLKSKIIKALAIKSEKIKAGVQNLDFELPSQAPLMKSFFISKD